MEIQTVKELRALAKERGIPKYYRMRKAELIDVVNDRPHGGARGEESSTAEPLITGLDAAQPPLKDSKPAQKYLCVHGRRKYFCKECGGSQICSHNKRKSRCRLCGGGSICEHNRNRYMCKDCWGRGICIHGRQRWFCKECGGSQICEHGKQKHSCKICKP